MTRAQKSFFIFTVAFATHVVAFSQPTQSALSVYQEGQSILSKYPKRAYALLAKSRELSLVNNVWDVYANSVNTLATLSLSSESDKQAEVLVWAREAIRKTKNAVHDSVQAQLYYNVALLSGFAYEIDESIRHFEQAKKIWKSLYGEWNKHVADCYHGLGDLYKYEIFDFREAEKCYETALRIRERINSADTRALLRNYYNLAATNRSQKDFEKALSYGSKTIAFAKRVKNDEALELSTGLVANIYRDMNESEMAMKYYHEALDQNRKTDNLSNRAWYYSSMGELQKNDSEYAAALANFSVAYKLYTEHKLPNKSLFVNLLIHQMETYRKEKDDKNFFNKVDEVFGALKELNKLNSKWAYVVFLNLGERQRDNQAYDSALYYYQKALMAVVPSFNSLNPQDNPTEEMIGFVYYVYEGLAEKATTLEVKYQQTKNPAYLQLSTDCLILAEKLLSKERNTLDMEDAKWMFLDANYDLYENIISNLFEGTNVLPRATYNSLAFRFFEQGKSRSLADALTQAEQRSQISDGDSLLQLHSHLKRKLFQVQDKINQQNESGDSSAEMIELRAEVVALDIQINTCKEQIEKKYPGYFNAKYGYKTPSLEDIQRVINEKKRVILEYFWGSQSVYALGISGKEVYFKRLGSPDSIKACINAVLRHLNDEHSSMDPEIFKSFTDNSRRLFAILVEPFTSLLTGVERIQIIPDGPIAQLPFEILLEQEASADRVDYRSLSYLLKNHTLGYAYSSSMLMHEEKRTVRSPSLLAIGFTGGERLRSAVDPDLEEIAGAELELDALTKRFHSGKFLRGGNATESNFKSLSPEYDIIHLAIHGKGDVQKNFSSSLFFRSKYDSIDDGELHAYELYGLKLNAVMAVLSSCESGLGKGYKGEGMISMASAFTFSGCENILMSLWKVNDQASIQLMDDFYGQLLTGSTIDEALRNAKLNYLRSSDELTADPKIWAPLVAYGSLDRVFEGSRIDRMLWVAAGILVVLLVIYFLLMRKRQKSIFLK